MVHIVSASGLTFCCNTFMIVQSYGSGKDCVCDCLPVVLWISVKSSCMNFCLFSMLFLDWLGFNCIQLYRTMV